MYMVIAVILMDNAKHTLAERLGKTVHVSALRFKLADLQGRYPSASACCVEAWLLRVANARNARIVTPPDGVEAGFRPPPLAEFPNEELVAAICHLQNQDTPQLLRLAAQLVSRGVVTPSRLRLVAERERVGIVLAELARQALKVDPHHDQWQQILRMFEKEMPPRDPLLHWSRLANPIMKDGRCNAAEWRLVA
jgi:hypothetical protein